MRFNFIFFKYEVMTCNIKPINPIRNFKRSSEKYENVNDPIIIPIAADGIINFKVSRS